MYSIEIDRQASKNLSKIPTKFKLKIIERIDALKQNPHPSGSIKLKGSEITYRFRVGIYRIIYDVHNTVLLIRVINIDKRNDVYK